MTEEIDYAASIEKAISEGRHIEGLWLTFLSNVDRGEPLSGEEYATMRYLFFCGAEAMLDIFGCANTPDRVLASLNAAAAEIREAHAEMDEIRSREAFPHDTVGNA